MSTFRKLTPPRRKMLSDLAAVGTSILYRPQQRLEALLALGYVTTKAHPAGFFDVRITDAGRKALAAINAERPRKRCPKGCADAADLAGIELTCKIADEWQRLHNTDRPGTTQRKILWAISTHAEPLLMALNSLEAITRDSALRKVKP